MKELYGDEKQYAHMAVAAKNLYVYEVCPVIYISIGDHDIYIFTMQYYDIGCSLIDDGKK